MSWPQDGEPRFVVVETVGHWRIRQGGRPAHLKWAPEHRTVAILDRAWAYRLVWKLRSEELRGARARGVAKAQRQAAERCAQLNAEYK